MFWEYVLIYQALHKKINISFISTHSVQRYLSDLFSLA